MCVTFSASEHDSDTAGDWRERPGSKVLEIWPVLSVRVKSFTKSNRFKAIFYGPNRHQRQIAGGLNWQASVTWVCIVDFRADDYFELWQDRARHGEKRQRTPDRRLGRRKLQLKCKFCFVFQHSFADKFSISYAFFRHEQHVSLMLPLSVLSEIIIHGRAQSLFLALGALVRPGVNS